MVRRTRRRIDEVYTFLFLIYFSYSTSPTWQYVHLFTWLSSVSAPLEIKLQGRIQLFSASKDKYHKIHVWAVFKETLGGKKIMGKCSDDHLLGSWPPLLCQQYYLVFNLYKWHVLHITLHLPSFSFNKCIFEICPFICKSVALVQ